MGNLRDELPAGLIPFAMDGGGGVWYLDVENRLGRA
ncbi:SMI1/KNR4 family protein [Corallococcus sp. CA054B]|nr:SMI1/KNR4 family protein [Corallococcus sp. CA054B]